MVVVLTVVNAVAQVIASQVERKLAAVKSELAAAQADCGRAESALKSKDKQKKWMKF